MLSLRLPVSGEDVVLRHPAGSEDFLLVEAGACDTRLALALASRVACPASPASPASPRGETSDWSHLPIADLDTLLLRLRQMLLGDNIRTDVLCSAEGCGSRIDVGFTISDYLAHHASTVPPGVAASDEAGVFELVGAGVSFRVPTAGDQVAIAHDPDPEAELLRRCVRPSSLPPETRARVEEAMESIAPNLQSDLEGVCPECGTLVRAPFDPQRWVLRELRGQAAWVYEEVHLLARRYRWSERDILALPASRRARYVDLLRAEGGA